MSPRNCKEIIWANPKAKQTLAVLWTDRELKLKLKSFGPQTRREGVLEWRWESLKAKEEGDNWASSRRWWRGVGVLWSKRS